jgi:LysM repeat protein
MTTTAGEAAAPVVPEEPASRSGPETEAMAGEAPGTVAAQAREAPAAAGAGSAEAAGTDKPWFSGHNYSVQRGDTLWGLSDDHYVNPYYWPHIWNHNQAVSDPDRIEIDQQLWLPTLQGEPRSLTAADRRSIAEGYLRLYRLWTETGAANPQYALVGVRYFDPEVMPPELRNDPSAGRPDDTLAAAFEAHLQAAFPRR